MKKKLIKLAMPILTACLALGPWFSYVTASILFFGEYEPPTEPEEE